MAQNRIRKFKTIGDAADFLNGAVLGGQVVKTSAPGSLTGVGTGIQGLVGLTLIFSSPSAATITFAASSGSGGSAHTPNTNPDPSILLLTDIRQQVAAGLATVTVKADTEGRLAFIESTPASGVTISHTGTANALLGLDTVNDSVGRFYKNAVISQTAPCWTWMQSDGGNATIIATYE